MEYGLQIMNSNGKIFATPDTPFFHLTSKQVLNLSQMNIGGKAFNYNTGISANLRMVCYTRLSGVSAVSVAQYQSNGTWWLRIESTNSCTAVFYIFTNDIPASSGGWGMDFFDGSGRRVYSTSTRPLQNMQTALTYRGTNAVDVGHPTAVIATICDSFVRPIQQRDVQLMNCYPCAYNNRIEITVVGRGVMPSESGFSFAIFGGVVNYINASLYD